MIDLPLQLPLHQKQPVHGPVAGVVCVQRQAGDVHVLGRPLRGRELRGGRQGGARDEGEEAALGGRVAAPPFEQAAQQRIDAEAPPERVEDVSAAERPRARVLEALTGGGEEPRPGIRISGEEARE